MKKNFKKLFSLFLSFILVFSNVFAYNFTYLDNNEVKKVEAVGDALIEKMNGLDKEKLEEFQEKLLNLILKLDEKINEKMFNLYSSEDCDNLCKLNIIRKMETYNEMIDYLIYIVENYPVYDIEDENAYDMIDEYNYYDVEGINVDEILAEGKETFSSSEATEVNNDMITMQNLIIDPIYENFTDWMGDYMERSKKNYNADLETSYNMSVKDGYNDVKFDLSLSVNDIVTLYKDLDQFVQGDFNLDIYSSNGIFILGDLTASGTAKYISKAGEMFFNVDDIDIENYGSNGSLFYSATSVLERLDKLDNYFTFYSGMDKQSQIKLNKLFTELMLGNWEGFQKNQAFFEVYKKEGETYYLIPTKYFCDTVVFLEDGYVCDEDEYQWMLEDYLSSDVRFKFQENGVNKKFFADIEDSTAKGNLYVDFTSEAIQKAQIKIDGKGYSEGNLIELIYNPKQDLNFKFILDEGSDDANINIEAKLDNDNKITYLDATGNAKQDEDEIMNGKFHLEDKQFSGNLKIKEMMYDYQISKNIIKAEFTANITGNTDSENKVENFDFNFVIDEEKNELDLNISKNYNTYTGDITAFNYGTDVEGDFRLAFANDNIDSGHFDLDVRDAQESGVLNIKLDDNIISGGLEVMLGTIKTVDADLSGKYDEDYLDMDIVGKYNSTDEDELVKVVNFDLSLLIDNVQDLKEIDVVVNVKDEDDVLDVHFDFNETYEEASYVPSFPNIGDYKTLYTIKDFSSMSPNYKYGDMVILQQDSNIERGDVVVYKGGYMGNTLGRIIGLPGETVKIEDGQVKVCENGNCRLLVESYLEEGLETNVNCSTTEYELENGYFILIDNRNSYYASDSRCNADFEISKEEIIGTIKDF